MPFFFDLSSLIPTVELNPFAPVVVHDEVPAEPIAQEMPAEPIVDTGLPIPAHYDFDMMHALVQDPFRLFVYWQLKDSPYERLRRLFPAGAQGDFHTTLKLIDETTNIAVFFDAAFAREYWFNVFPDRAYRIELGLRSPRYGYIKLLTSQPVRTPRGGPSDQEAAEEEYQIAADDYLQVLRESHLVPERAFTLAGLLPGEDAAPTDARHAVWETLPASFHRVLEVINDIRAGRDYERWWERLSQEELAGLVREFLTVIKQMGDGELGYMLLLRYLPELLRRAIRAEEALTGTASVERELQIDKPIALYLAEKLGQAASEFNQPPAPDNVPRTFPRPGAPGSIEQGQWLPSMNL